MSCADDERPLLRPDSLGLPHRLLAAFSHRSASEIVCFSTRRSNVILGNWTMTYVRVCCLLIFLTTKIDGDEADEARA